VATQILYQALIKEFAKEFYHSHWEDVLNLKKKKKKNDDDGGGEGGGEAPFPPSLPGVLSPPPPLCIEGLEPSPCDITVHSIMTFIISLNCMRVCLKSASSSGTRS
jgi:hypothetical protein